MLASVVSLLFILQLLFITSTPNEVYGQDEEGSFDHLDSLAATKNISDEERERYARSLIELADSKKLYDRKLWYNLLHYKKKLFGVESLVDAPRFFLDENGKYDPRAELHATIRYFIIPSESLENPVCRFMARYAWLRKELQIDEAYVPVERCEKYNEIKNLDENVTASIAFPAGYMNSPASIFGHTLITLQSRHNPGLLSTAINYAARTGEEFGPVFAFRGIFGLYNGYFSIQPYYEKVQEYSDIDQRDMWEYRLNLTRDEIEMLMFHVWEMDNIYSRYYFFGENCSYSLLFLLEAARSGTDITDKFGLWVIPVDTVREVKKAGFVDEVIYRPSRATKIEHMASCLDDNEQELAKRVALGEAAPGDILEEDISREKKIRILDLATDFAKYRYARREYPLKKYQKVFIGTLNARSQLGNEPEVTYEYAQPVSPEHGHLASRVGLGAGIKGTQVFEQLMYRPSYHDLLDNDNGYVPGSQIIFGEAVGRYYHEDSRFELEKFDIISIESISPRNRFFAPMSWKVKTGLYKKTFSENESHLVYRINTGGGYAYSVPYIGTVYGMVEMIGDGGPSLDYNVAAGPGAVIGIISQPFSFWKMLIKVSDHYYALGDTHNWFEGAIGHQLFFSRNFNIRADFTIRHIFDTWENEAVIQAMYYF
ncbi:MAG: DUF4105 domain-containing protein [Spirochaetota bacterium]